MDCVITNEVNRIESEQVDKNVNDVISSVKSTDESEIEVTEKKKRVPRRVLHFSDGTLEEYSSDEDDNDDSHIKKTTVSEVNAVDPQTLTWGPWVWYKTVTASSKTLRACDYVGEKLAKFFGITTPKYEYEIDVYESLKLQEEEEKKQRDLEMGGWAGTEDTSLQTSAPNQTR